MILPLRRRHRRLVMVIGVFLPVVFAVGIGARKPVPGMSSLPKELVATQNRFSVTQWERADLFRKTPIHVRLLREHAGAGRFALELSAAKDFVKPDLLVYWVTGTPGLTDTLPANARLLGAFASSTALSLATDAGSESGVLVLYSLADQEIVEVSKPFTPQKP